MEEKSQRFEMRVSKAFLAKIDSWRREQPDLPARSDAIRQLVEKALDDNQGA